MENPHNFANISERNIIIKTREAVMGAKAETVTSKSVKTKVIARIPINSKSRIVVESPLAEPSPPSKKRKAPVKNEEAEDNSQEPALLEPIEEEDMFLMATRAPGKNAKGHNRRVSKGKRSSAANDEEEGAVPDPPGRKKRTADARDGSAVGITGKPSGLAILGGAETLFHAQRVGSKGVRASIKKHSQRSAITPSRVELDAFERLVSQFDPLTAPREALFKAHLRRAYMWLWQLQLNFSVLLYGVGSKVRLLNTFAKDYLSGEDVIMLDGSGSGKPVKLLLDTIAEEVLKLPHLGSACLSLDTYADCVKDALQIHYHRWRPMAAGSLFSATSYQSLDDLAAKSKSSGAGADESEASSGLAPVPLAPADSWSWKPSRALRYTSSALDAGDADPSWGGRFTHAKAKLYIAVHSIDGETLQNMEAQRVLASLAECPSVSVIATCDSVNTTLLWSSDMQTKFRWSFQHVPTFESYALPANFALLSSKKGAVPQERALEYILGSLTNRHKELLALLAQEKVKETNSSNGGGSTGASKGISLDDLFALASKGMIVTNSSQLNSYLKELEDHRLVNVVANAAKKKCVVLNTEMLEKGGAGLPKP